MSKMEKGPSIQTALIELQKPVTPEGFWIACDRLFRAAMPIFHTLLGLPCLGITPTFMRSTFPFPDLDGFMARLAELAPLNDTIAQSPGIPVARMSDFLLPETAKTRAWREEVMEPGGWSHSAALLFWRSDGSFLGQLSAIRSAEQGDFTDMEMTLLREIHPQVNVAVERLFALEQAAAERVSLESLISPLPLPMVTVGWDLTLNFTNGAACDAMNAWIHGEAEGRSRKPERVLPADLRAACFQLKEAWGAAVRADDSRAVPRSVALEHPTSPGFQAEIRIIESGAGRALQPSFNIIFHLPAARNHEASRALENLARLTRTEQEVAKLAASGCGNAEISAHLGISPHTVRAHLRHVFEKLGITNRARLAPLYAALQRATVLALLVAQDVLGVRQLVDTAAVL